MDLFDLVYQVRMDLEDARLSNYQLDFYKEQTKRRLRNMIIAMDTATTSGASLTQPQQPPDVEASADGGGSILMSRIEALEQELKKVVKEKTLMETQFTQMETLFADLRENLMHEARNLLDLLGQNQTNSSAYILDEASGVDGKDRIQSMFSQASFAVSHLKSVNASIVQEMTSLREGQRTDAVHLQTRLLRMDDAGKEINGELQTAREELEKTREELEKTKDELEKRREELEDTEEKLNRSRRETNELKDRSTELALITPGSSSLLHLDLPSNGLQPVVHETISSKSSGNCSGLPAIPSVNTSCNSSSPWSSDDCLRIRQLELQVKRMEYRARNAEECCRSLKVQLNRRLTGSRQA